MKVLILGAGGTIITGFEWCGDARVNVSVENLRTHTHGILL